MIGDKLVITAAHRERAARVVPRVEAILPQRSGPVAVSVAGESGAGKSETAAALADALGESGRVVTVLGQDDYFHLPPASNTEARRRDIGWVGPQEVRLDLLADHVAATKRGDPEIVKPLVFFEEDRIGEESVDLRGIDVLIIEGTYVTLVEGIDLRIFIAGTYRETLEHRRARARDEVEGEFIERVLEIEHRIISAHRERADIVV